MTASELDEERTSDPASEMFPRAEVWRETEGCISRPCRSLEEAIGLEPFRVIECLGRAVTFRDAKPDMPAFGNHELVPSDVLVSPPDDELALPQPQSFSYDAV